MDVYIEAVIIDNFFITWLLASITYRALNIQNCKLRCLLVASVGTTVAIVYPFLQVHWAIVLGIRIATYVGLSVILFYKKPRPVLASLVFLAFTFTFGGALFALGLAIHGNLYYALTKPATTIPPGAIIAAGLLVYYLLKRVSRRLKRANQTKEYSYSISLEILGQAHLARGFLDTGNSLYCQKTDLPIVVIGTKLSLKILGDKGLSALLRGKINEIDKSARFIYYSGADGKKSKMLLLNPDIFLVYNGQAKHKIEGVVLGLALSAYSNFLTEYDVLLHPSVCS